MSRKNSVIRCPIHGSIDLNKRERAIIDTPFFQRLRFISQLGFASYVYPGAVHTRFSHSLGTMHLSGLFFDQLLNDESNSLKRYFNAEKLHYARQILRFAALLHDIGHPPFSHSMEDLLPPLSQLSLPAIPAFHEERQSTHEDFSLSVIYSFGKETNPLLSSEEIQDIAAILNCNIPPSDQLVGKSSEPDIISLLRQMISGEIDVDRMDYLWRDSLFAGVTYGKFDLDRLITSLSCWLNEENGHFHLSLDGANIPTYENFLLARFHMFIQVYHHKTLAAFIFYLKKVIEEREITMSIDGSLEQFLTFTEHAVLESLRANAHKKWAGKITRRIPAKNLLRVIGRDEENRIGKLKSFLDSQGIEILHTHSKNTFSSQNKNAENIEPHTLMVAMYELGKTKTLPIQKVSTLIREPRDDIEISQLFVHREDYDRTLQILRTSFN